MKQTNLIRHSVAALLAGTTSVALPVLAQDTPAPELEEIVVTGYRAVLDESIAAKRESPMIVEVISADAIGQMPNVTIAESLVRLPGINGARDRGNESQASVRGLGPRMVLGLVNGREIASSEPNRNVRWEIMPSDVVQRVTVYKAQSADLIAGGVAATIDIGTVNPLDYQGPEFSTSLGATYYDKGQDISGYNPLGYIGSFSWVSQLSDNLGLAISASTQKQKNAYPSIQGWGYTDSSNAMDVNGDGTLDYTPWGGQTELKKLDQDRNGVLAALQWRGDSVELKWDAVYSEININEDQNQTWFNDWAYSIWSGSNPYTTPGSSYTIHGGDVVAGTLNNSYRKVSSVVGKYDEDKSLFATGLNGQWELGEWTAVGDLSYSEAKRKNTWKAVELLAFPATVSYDWRVGGTPSITLSSTDLSDPPAPGWDGQSGMRDGPEQLDDELWALALSGSRKLDGAFTSLQLGARGSERTKSHEKHPWSTWAGSDAPLSAYDGMLSRLRMPGLNVPRMLDGNLSRIAAVAFGGFPAVGPENLADHWSVDESALEGFIKGNFEVDAAGLPVDGNIGVRVVSVDTTSKGHEWLGPNLVPVKESNSYTEFLPSVSANLHLNDDQVLRGAIARVMSRPPLDELSAARWRDPPTNSGQLYGGGGNPQLDPLLAWQYDVSWEWYFHQEAMLALAVYYKDVSNTIGHQQNHQTIDGDDYLITSADNIDGGGITGVEVTLNTPFYFIPGMQNFGVYANYAYVNSNIKEVVPAGNELDGDGVAENTAVMDLWYSSGPFEVRLGQKYHSAFTAIYGWDSSVLGRIEPEYIVDASTSWQVTDAINLKLQVGNLTDEPLRIYRDNQPGRLVRYDEYGRRWLLQATFTF